MDSAGRKGVEEAVRAHYAAAAQRGTGCCGDGRQRDQELTGIGADAYGAGELDDVPAQVAQTSLGCANPVVVAELAQGETVLDLGSGAGIDVLLSARRVGPSGKAYGLDMTEEMLQLARTHQAAAGVDNAEFLPGIIEAIPLPDHSVDVVMSNCVIGLSADKRSVFAEAFRVLRPGGRLAIADVVAAADPGPTAPADLASWVACVAGALTRSQYHAGLERAGFADVLVEEVHPVADGYTSVVVRAVKPAA
jgi:arsenite methyltransferase